MPIPARRGSKLTATAPRPSPWFEALLNGMDAGKRQLHFAKGTAIYSQGQTADAVYFIQRGKIRLSVLSKAGQEAILGDLIAGEFCGEGCLAMQVIRVGSATAASAATVLRVEAAALIRALHDQHPLSEAFLAHVLARNIAFEEDVCDQLFNHSEKRLAQALLKLAHFGQESAAGQGNVVSPRISHEALAAMIGTTRSRVNFFMNKFRRLGLIDYNGEIHVYSELLTDIVLTD
jgi:CRP-like cAMP-binding protein